MPVPATMLQGVDSLLSIAQMPRGIPVATVAIGNARNAGLLGGLDDAAQSRPLPRAGPAHDRVDLGGAERLLLRPIDGLLGGRAEPLAREPIVDLLQTEIARIVHLPDVKEKLLAVGLEPNGMSQAEFAAYIKADIAKWKKVIADAKIPRIGG